MYFYNFVENLSLNFVQISPLLRHFFWLCKKRQWQYPRFWCASSKNWGFNNVRKIISEFPPSYIQIPSRWGRQWKELSLHSSLLCLSPIDLLPPHSSPILYIAVLLADATMLPRTDRLNLCFHHYIVILWILFICDYRRALPQIPAGLMWCKHKSKNKIFQDRGNNLWKRIKNKFARRWHQKSTVEGVGVQWM